jgi:hypothetical protein
MATYVGIILAIVIIAALLALDRYADGRSDHRGGSPGPRSR